MNIQLRLYSVSEIVINHALRTELSTKLNKR